MLGIFQRLIVRQTRSFTPMLNMHSIFRPPPKLSILFPFSFVPLSRAKSTGSKKGGITRTWGKTKQTSTRIGKKYKLKNHKGAVARWMVIGHGFKRLMANRSHLNRKNNAMKKIRKRKRIAATPIEKRLLKKLIPYYKKKYLK
jgi:ribosomal protein L35